MTAPSELLPLPSPLHVEPAVVSPPQKLTERETEQARRFLRRVLVPSLQEDLADCRAMSGWQWASKCHTDSM